MLKNGCMIVQSSLVVQSESLHDCGLILDDFPTSSMLIQSGAYQFFIDFELSFMSIFPVDKVDVLYVLEWPLLLVHSSYENV